MASPPLPLPVPLPSTHETQLELREEELLALRKLREAIRDVIHEKKNFDNNAYLLKWLRARKLNVSKAEKMIRRNLAFRREHWFDYLDNWTVPEAFEKYLPYRILGEDHGGRPIVYFHFGMLDFKGAVQCGSKMDYQRFLDLKMQKVSHQCQIQSEKHGRLIDQCVVVIDLEGASFQTHFNPRTLSYIQTLIRSLEDDYPEFTALCVILNNMPIFHLCWELVSRFIDEGSKKKIRLIRPNEYKEKMRRIIPTQYLPQCFGGTSSLKDPFSDSAYIPGPIPEKYYLKNILEEERGSELTLVTVPPRTISLVPVVVREAGSVLHWVFKTESYDVSFSVHYLPLTETGPPTERKCVLANQRYDSHLVPDQSYLVCQLSGTYFLHFDNSYSWVHSKQVRYFYNVVQPNS